MSLRHSNCHPGAGRVLSLKTAFFVQSGNCGLRRNDGGGKCHSGIAIVIPAQAGISLLKQRLLCSQGIAAFAAMTVGEDVVFSRNDGEGASSFAAMTEGGLTLRRNAAVKERVSSRDLLL